MEKTDIDKFLKNVKEMGQPDKQRVNVLYLTTACNLQCSYCYETDSRAKLEKPIRLTFNEIRDFFDEIQSREAGQISTVVIMGGEPFLEYPSVCYAMTYMAHSEHNWGVTITTNGTIADEIKNVCEHQNFSDNIKLTLEISYDGSGQDRRKYYNGMSSRKKVENLLDELSIKDKLFALSYTIHKDNYKNLLYDMIFLCEKYKPTKISLSPYCQELDEVTGDYKKFMAVFVPYAEYITEKYGIPICDLACRTCGKCDKSNFEGSAYMSPTTGLTYQDQKTEKVFDNF